MTTDMLHSRSGITRENPGGGEIEEEVTGQGQNCNAHWHETSDMQTYHGVSGTVKFFTEDTYSVYLKIE